MIAYDHAQPAPAVEDAVSLHPDDVEVVDIILVGVVEADLTVDAVIFQLPVRRRRDDEMDRTGRNFAHVSGIAYHYGVGSHKGASLAPKTALPRCAARPLWGFFAAGSVFMNESLFLLAVEGNERPATAASVDVRLLRHLGISACKIAELEKEFPRVGPLHILFPRCRK